MSCGSKTSAYAKFACSVETAKSAPWYLRIFGVLYAALEKRRQRGLLRDLDNRLLADIGLTREQADRESNKPFWR
jgi:uncharacterized protein YjiS (DUF1127 family)